MPSNSSSGNILFQKDYSPLIPSSRFNWCVHSFQRHFNMLVKELRLKSTIHIYEIFKKIYTYTKYSFNICSTSGGNSNASAINYIVQHKIPGNFVGESSSILCSTLIKTIIVCFVSIKTRQTY
jgi:hypothetical protein